MSCVERLGPHHHSNRGYCHVSIEHVTLEKKEEYSETELHDIAIHKIAKFDCKIQLFSTSQEQEGASVYIKSKGGEEICSLEFPADAYFILGCKSEA